MTEQARVLLFDFFLSVGAAWFVYSYLYKRVRLDAFREELFTLRDDLFDYMEARGLPFSTHAYGLLRSSINGMIRSANDGSFNLVTLSVYIRAFKESEKAAARTDTVSAAIAAIDELEARKHFEQVFDKIGRLGLRHVWFEGPLSLALTPALIVLLSRWEERKEEVVEVGVELDRHEKDGLVPQAA